MGGTLPCPWLGWTGHSSQGPRAAPLPGPPNIGHRGCWEPTWEAEAHSQPLPGQLHPWTEARLCFSHPQSSGQLLGSPAPRENTGDTASPGSPALRELGTERGGCRESVMTPLPSFFSLQWAGHSGDEEGCLVPQGKFPAPGRAPVLPALSRAP